MRWAAGLRQVEVDGKIAYKGKEQRFYKAPLIAAPEPSTLLDVRMG